MTREHRFVHLVRSFVLALGDRRRTLLRPADENFIQIRSSAERGDRLPAARDGRARRAVALSLRPRSARLHGQPLPARRLVRVRPLQERRGDAQHLHRGSPVPAEEFLERPVEVPVALHVLAEQRQCRAEGRPQGPGECIPSSPHNPFRCSRLTASPLPGRSTTTRTETFN